MLYRVTYHKKIVILLITGARVFILRTDCISEMRNFNTRGLTMCRKDMFLNLTEANFEPRRKNAVS